MRQVAEAVGPRLNAISIHAPREGCDSPRTPGEAQLSSFQSTHPARGATLSISFVWPSRSNFNPRTPRGVRRATTSAWRLTSYYFNPRTPRGVRQFADGQPWMSSPVSIHAPREGCDGSGAIVRPGSLDISIHAPREGCDVWHLADKYTQLPFQSTHPARGATALWL